MAGKVSVKIEGYDELRAKLAGDPIFARPWVKALGKATEYGKTTAQGRAPRDSGTLAGGMTSRLQASPIPFYGVVSNDVQKRGARYGFILNAGWRKSKRGRFRAGAAGRISIFHFRGTNRLTKGWFSGTLAKIRPEVNRLLDAAAKEIESAWGR